MSRSGAPQPARVAAAVEPLVMVEHQPRHLLREAAARAPARCRPPGCCLITSNSSSVSAPGFWRISFGTASLPTSWSSPPTASSRSAHRRQPQLLAHLHGPQRHAARVLGRVVVLHAEPHEQRAHRRAHERVGRAHQLAGAQVLRERARLGAAVQVERHRHADQPDADQLPAVTDPPAELVVLHQQAGNSETASSTSPNTTVRSAKRRVSRYVRPRARAERAVEHDAHDRARSRRPCCRPPARAGTSCGSTQADRAEHDDQREQHGLKQRAPACTAAGPLQLGDRRERQHRAAHGQRRRAREGHQAVHPDEEARASSARGCRAARPSRRTPSRSPPSARRRGARPTTVSTTAAAAARPALMPSARKWTAAGDLDLRLPEEVDDGSGHDGARREQREQGDGPLTQEAAHCRHVSDAAGPLEAPCARGDRLRGRGTARRRRTTARPGSSCCARSRARASRSTSCARRPRTTGWRCSPWSACSRARASSTRSEELAEETGLDPHFLDEAAPRARRAGARARRARDHRGGARAVAERQGAARRRASPGGVPRAHRRDEPLDGERRRRRSPRCSARRSCSPGDTERDLGLRYAETLRNLGPAGGADARADVQPAPARADARGRDQPGRAPERPAAPARSRSRVGFVDIVGFTRARRGRASRRSSARWCAASSARSPTPSSRPCGS